MKSAPRHLVATLGLVMSLAGLACQSPDRCVAVKEGRATLGAVATIHPMATDAALNTLRAGGNAVDAAVSAMLTLGVVDGHNSGIGGGCFILIRMADGRTEAIDARETAPRRAWRDMYVRAGKPDTSLSQTGPLAVATPGALAGYSLALQRFGRKSLAELLIPAAEIADKGFSINRNYAEKLAREAPKLKQFPESAAVFLPSGTPPLAGQQLKQPDLARTYRSIATQGTDYFYRGQFAQRLGSYMAQTGGILDAEDLARYTPKIRQPIMFAYRGLTFVTMPPPSSGGLQLAQIFGMLDRFDLGRMSEADRITTVANAMTLSFADRARWLGDPDHVQIPPGLIDREYIARRSNMIVSDAALTGVVPGSPPSSSGTESDKHTTHVSVVDAAGNVASITATINTAFGSKVTVPGTGVVLNNEMDDFSLAADTPNAFRLVGSEGNAVGPLKRPLSSMTPTVVLREGKPLYVVGAAGGPRIITQVACVLINLIDLHMTPADAMAASRFHQQWRPETLWIEESAFMGESGKRLQNDLAARGFQLEIKPGVGATNLVMIGENAVTAVSEPRAESGARAE